MKYVYLVRHGQTDANKNKIWIGARSQYKLNDDGRKEAAYAGAKLREFELDATEIYASPVERALQTAKIVQSKLALPIVPIPDLSEMFFGDLEGYDEQKFETDFPLAYAEWLKSSLDFYPPNGESGRRFYVRAIEAITEISTTAKTQDVIIITHSGIIKMFLANILQIDLNVGWRNLELPETSTGSITKIFMNDSKFSFLENINIGIDG